MTNQTIEKLDKELKKFNWGAFLMPFLWAIFNRVWIVAVCSLIIIFYIIEDIDINIFHQMRNGWVLEILALIIFFFIGKIGNRLAWQSKQWDSLESFIEAQKNYTYYMLLTFCCVCSLVLLLVFIRINIRNDDVRVNPPYWTKVASNMYIDTQNISQVNTGFLHNYKVFSVWTWEQNFNKKEELLINCKGGSVGIRTIELLDRDNNIKESHSLKYFIPIGQPMSENAIIYNVVYKSDFVFKNKD